MVKYSVKPNILTNLVNENQKAFLVTNNAKLLRLSITDSISLQLIDSVKTQNVLETYNLIWLGENPIMFINCQQGRFKGFYDTNLDYFEFRLGNENESSCQADELCIDETFRIDYILNAEVENLQSELTKENIADYVVWERDEFTANGYVNMSIKIIDSKIENENQNPNLEMKLESEKSTTQLPK